MTIRTARTAAEALADKLSPGPFDDEPKVAKPAPPKEQPPAAEGKAPDLSAWSLDRLLEGAGLAAVLDAAPKDADAKARWTAWCARRHPDQVLVPSKVGPLYVAEVLRRHGGSRIDLAVPDGWRDAA